jgi:hypothetical protein
MRNQDQAVFQEAARRFERWILVRRTSPQSLKYIGMPGYTPKPQSCKAKTANGNVGRYELAGLVASPEIHPSAFGNAGKAMQFWKETKTDQMGFAVDMDRNSKHFGCLKYQGNYIHGDYDLKDIVDPSQPFRNLALVTSGQGGMLHVSGPSLNAIKTYINGRIGSPVVQHGEDAAFREHGNEAIDAFGPNGQHFTILGPSLARFYEENFGGRKTLTIEQDLKGG